jgi:UDP-N-acetylglucosamine:LPS N-acetylglucosamine transferase
MPTQDIAHDLRSIYQKDRELLGKTKLPVMTVSASFKEDLKGLHKQKETDKDTDIVLSRAHYSMALGVAIQAWGKQIDPRQAWLVDSTNYVSLQAEKGVALTHLIGKTIARWPILKTLKDLVDKFGRSKMPILDNVTPPTLYLSGAVTQPILSMHIVVGNILAAEGKTVFQMITDPHVRPDYLDNAHLANMRFFVFDEATKAEFFAVAKKIGKKIPAEQIRDKVIVTGPPIDPRITAINQEKSIWKNDRELRILLTTGGLGTNKPEIKSVLEQLLPELARQQHGEESRLPEAQLVFYAGTHADHRDMALEIASKHRIKTEVISPKDPAAFRIGEQIKYPKIEEKQAKFTIIYHPQIVDANELLIHEGLAWADLVISKPSGDMAYDAVAAGTALLTLQEWGEWEHNVREFFEQKAISQKAQVDDIVAQLSLLTQEETANAKLSQLKSSPVPALQIQEKPGTSWLSQAMEKAKKLDKIFYQGAKNIIAACQK